MIFSGRQICSNSRTGPASLGDATLGIKWADCGKLGQKNPTKAQLTTDPYRVVRGIAGRNDSSGGGSRAAATHLPRRRPASPSSLPTRRGTVCWEDREAPPPLPSRLSCRGHEGVDGASPGSALRRCCHYPPSRCRRRATIGLRISFLSGSSCCTLSRVYPSRCSGAPVCIELPTSSFCDGGTAGRGSSSGR